MKYTKEEIEQKIHNTVYLVDNKAEVYLFGSRARGDENNDSDWDILILTENKAEIKEEQKFRHYLVDTELEIEEVFSIFVYNKHEWNIKYSITPFYHNVVNEYKKI